MSAPLIFWVSFYLVQSSVNYTLTVNYTVNTVNYTYDSSFQIVIKLGSFHPELLDYNDCAI